MSKKRNYKVGDVVRFHDDKRMGEIIAINLNYLHLIEIGIYNYYDFYNALTCVVEDLKNHCKLTISMNDINGIAYEINIIKDRLKGENKTMGMNISNNKMAEMNEIIRRIKDYKVINNKVVIVYFMDGSTEKAVCDENDVFDIERAIEICVLKNCFGASNYASIYKSAMKKIKSIDENKAVMAKEEERLAKKREKNAKKKAERIAKRKYAERQEQIAIQSAAFLQAMKDYDQLAVNMNHEEFMEEIERLNSAKELDVEIVVPGSDKN